MGDHWIGSIQSTNLVHLEVTMQAFILAILPMVALAAHPAPAYGGYGPHYKCRDTNTSVYAEVCVPAFAQEVTPQVLDVKVVVDNDYCYNQIRTVCELTTQTVSREICTYTYVSEKSVQPAQTTQVTYEDKSETMKVTTCSPSGYGDHYGAGEHQYCRAEYQTQAYRVPLVTVPLDVTVEPAVPVPVKECVTKEIVIDEVVCNDIVEEKCFNVAKFEDSTNTVDQIGYVLGEPNCNAVTLTLPTQACSKGHY